MICYSWRCSILRRGGPLCPPAQIDVVVMHDACLASDKTWVQERAGGVSRAGGFGYPVRDSEYVAAEISMRLRHGCSTVVPMPAEG